jgi:RHS repeat-associated protein
MLAVSRRPWLALAFVVAFTLVPSRALAGAGVEIDSKIDSTSITPKLGLTLAVDHPSAIPGDPLGYSGLVTNTGAALAVNGRIAAKGDGGATSTVASYFYEVDTCASNCTQASSWKALAGFANTQPGYTPKGQPGTASGLGLTSTPVAASGVTYPSAGDPILGTQITSGSIALWKYQATIPLTPAQIATLSDPNQTLSIRSLVHLEVTDPSGVPALPSVATEIFNPFQENQNPAALTAVKVIVTLPDGSQQTITQTTVPALAQLKPGQSAAYAAHFTVPVPAAKGQTESDAAYLARLSALEGSTLQATAAATATGPTGQVTAPPPPAVTTQEHLPVLGITKTGPTTVDAGTTETNPLALLNNGGAVASGLLVTDSLPGGATGTVSGLPTRLNAGGTASAVATFPVPPGQPAGALTDTAALSWQDANGNVYGPVSSSFTTQVANALAGAKLTLAPPAAGPDPVGSSQKLTATLIDRNNAPIANQVIAFAVTGANPSTLNVTTDAAGTASLTYSGANPGTDVVQATAGSGATALPSNTASVVWVKPVATISTTAVQGNFFAEAPQQASFVAKPGDTPAFAQTFPAIEFNPPSGIVNRNVSGVGPSTRPFTDVLADPAGNFMGTVVAQGNGVQAGTGTLSTFNAVFTASFVVAQAGDVTFNVVVNDGFLLGVGGGATRVSGAFEFPPPSNTSAFNGYNLVGAFNGAGAAAPQTFPVTVHFPAAGSYPYELDYNSCCNQQLSLTMTVATFTADTSPLSVYVGYADGLRPAGSVFPFPWQGSPGVANFIGSGATPFDAGAIRFDNNSDTPIVFSDVSVDIGSTHLDLWGSGITVAPHTITILTQTVGNNFDTSDFPITCTPTGVIPQVHVTQNGATTTFADTTQVLNTKGIDPPSCGVGNESLPWQRIGGGGKAINVPLPSASTLTLSPTTVTGDVVGSTQTIRVAAVDGSGQAVTNLPLTVGVAGANSTQLGATTDASGTAVLSYVGTNAGTDTVQATAFVSGFRNVSNSLTVPWAIPVPGGPPSGGTPQQAPPAITAPSPADGSVVTKPVPVGATFTPPAGQTIASWSVTYQGAHATAPVTLASGTGTPPSPLATFDPTLLDNDTYTITTSATTSGGGTQAAAATVTVLGNLKPGRYVSTYKDVDVAVSGFQMQVLRLYDSYDKSTGDFGVGGHVALGGFRVSSNRALGDGGWSEYPTRCVLAFCFYNFRSSAPHMVTVTFPDQHQEVFDFTPTGGVGPFYWLGDAAFTARPGTGTTSTLQVTGGTSLVSGFDGTIRDSIAGSVYNPTRFTLTTVSGQVFVLDTTTGLVSETDKSGNSLSVDAAGIHASNGESIAFTRDAANRIAQVAEPNGGHIAYTYTAAGDLAGVSYPNGTTYSYTYDANHDLLSASGPGNQPFARLEYDASGRLVATTDGAGNRTAITNDVAGQRQIVTSPSGRQTTIDTLDDRGDIVRHDLIGDGQTLTTTTTYDSAGRLLSTTDPLGHTSTTTYDANGLVSTLTDYNGRTLQYGYAPNGLVQSLTAPDGTVLASLTYDAAGRVTREQRADGSASTFTYDNAGHTLSVTDGSGRTLKYTYDALGHLASATDPQGGVETVSVDAMGLVTAIRDALGATTTLAYDGNGNLLGVTDALGHATTYAYDAFDRITSTTDPLGKTATNTYDGAGRRVSTTDRDGATITYQYDADGNLLAKTLPGGDVTTLTNSAFGDVLTATNASAQLSFTYDAGAEVVTATSTGTAAAPQPTVTHTYAYDPNGFRTSVSGPEGSLAYTYDPLARLKTLTDYAGGTFTYGYDPLSRLTSLQRPNGVTDTLTYNASGNLLSKDAASPAGTVARADYTYDSLGQRTSLTDLTGTSTFTYDAIQQLTGATHPAASGLGAESYSYDLTGNRTSPAGSTTYDAGNELLQDALFSYTYDAEGNRLTRTALAGGATTRYTWDAEHHLLATALPDGSTVTYRYDPLGRRVEMAHGSQVTRYAWDESALSAEYDGANALQATYVHGLTPTDILEMTRGGQRFFHVTDGQGSVTALTDAFGNAVQRYTYDSFGNATVSGGVANPFTFTGQVFDAATGMYSTRFRSYDPAAGRYLSQDPLPGPNLYPYVSNDPVNRTDPAGAQDAEEEATLESSTVPVLRAGEADLHAKVTGDVTVYIGRGAKTGKCYFGITNNIERRVAQHGKRFKEVIDLELKLGRQDARVIEQRLITEYGPATKSGLGPIENKINSIVAGGAFFNTVTQVAANLLDVAALLEFANGLGC